MITKYRDPDPTKLGPIIMRYLANKGSFFDNGPNCWSAYVTTRCDNAYRKHRADGHPASVSIDSYPHNIWDCAELLSHCVGSFSEVCKESCAETPRKVTRRQVRQWAVANGWSVSKADCRIDDDSGLRNGEAVFATKKFNTCLDQVGVRRVFGDFWQPYGQGVWPNPIDFTAQFRLDDRVLADSKFHGPASEFPFRDIINISEYEDIHPLALIDAILGERNAN